MKPSIYIHIRTLLITLLLLLSGNGAWGQTFGDVSAATTREYTISVSASETSKMISIAETNMGGDIYTQLIADLGKTEEQLKSGFYFRWYLIDRNGNYVNNTTSPFAQNQPNSGYSHKWVNGDMYWYSNIAASWENNLSDNGGNKPKILNANYTPTGTSDSKWYDYKAVFVATSVMDGIVVENSQVTTEPTTFQVKYIFTFDDGYTPPVDPFENVPDDLTATQGTSTIYEYSAPENITINLKDYNNSITTPSYIRWCFADKNGNVVDNPGFVLSNGDIAYNTQGQSIYFGGTTTDANEHLLNITVTPQAGKSFADLASYKLVAYLSNELGTIENEALTKEPLISSKYEISFNFVPFASELPEASKRHTSTIIVNDENATSVSLPLSEHWETIKDDLGSETVNYLRYYLLDASDNVVITGSLSSDKGISFENNNIIGNYWLKPSETVFDNEMLDFTATVTSGKIYDYKFVVLLSSNEATYTDDTWSKEPTLQSMYTYAIKYVDPNFDGQLYTDKSGASVIQKNVKVSITEGQTSVTINDIVTDWEAAGNNNGIRALFDENGNNGNAPKYRRVYIRNRQTKELLSNQADWLKNDGTYSWLNAIYYYTSDGYFWTKSYIDKIGSGYIYSDFNNTYFKSILSTAVNLPSGSSLTLEDVEVVFILSNEDARSEDINTPTITQGPATHQVEYYFTFDDGTFSFENVPDGVNEFSGNVKLSRISTLPFTINLSDYYNIEGSAQEDIRYVRWTVEDNNGNIVDWNTAGITLTPKDGYSFTAQGNSLYCYNSGGVTADLLTVNVGAANLANLGNYKLKAYVSANESDIAATEQEPEIQGVYTVSLDYVQFYNVPSLTPVYGTVYVTDQTAQSVSVSLDAFNNALGSPMYVRWYLTDDYNNVMQNANWTLATEGISYETYENSIYHLSDAASDALKTITVTAPQGVDITSYKIVAMVSTKTDGDELENETLLREPTIENQYIVSFEQLTFEGSTSNAKALDKTIRLEDEQTNEAVLSLEDSEYETLISNTANEDSRFYVRWYVADKSGNKANVPGLTITHESNTLKNNQYGYYWYKDSGITKDDLAVTVTAPAGTDLRDYNVVALMSSNAPLEIDAEGNVVYEPREIELIYTYYISKPVSNDFDGYFAKNGVKKEVKVLINDGMTSVMLNDLSYDYGAGRLSHVLADPPKYRRFYIRNKKTKELLANQGDWLQKYDANYSHYIVNENGHFWTNLYAVSKYDEWTWKNMTTNQDDRHRVMKVNVVVPSGYTIDDLKNYEVVGVLSISPELEYDYTTDANNPQLTKGPEEYSVEYIFSFYTEDELTFNHYKGITGRDWETVADNPLKGKFVNDYFDKSEYATTTDDIRQGTHEWTYEIYVKRGETVKLVLPFQNVESGGQSLEPNGYFRWYDWNTDFMSSKITPFGDASNNKLKELFKQSIDGNEVSRGLFYWWNSTEDLFAHDKNMAAVNFTAPADEMWTGDVIACDVSKYIDGMNSDCSVLLHEPTLSTRYKFIVRPAKDIADAIKESYENGNCYEDHGNVSIGTTAGGTHGATKLRLNLKNPHLYYFYNYNEVDNSWGTTLCQATQILWNVYDEEGNKAIDNEVVSGSVMWEFNGSRYYYVNNESKAFERGNTYRVVASLSDGTNKAPVASFNCMFLDYTPQQLSSLSTTRSTQYLEQHYSRVGRISFDIEEGSTLNIPTYPLDNMNPMPFKWQRSHYGYCYPQLYSYLAGSDYKGGKYGGLSPLHGDYTILKSMNLAGVSENGNSDGYNKIWWQNGLLQDMTHYYTNGSQDGYFLYVDASDESRPIANVEFEGEMCTGSTMILAAMVANMTSGAVLPQLMFKLYGVHTDAAGNEISRKLIHSFATSTCTNVANEWFQIYAKVTLPNNTGVENYQHFLVSIDNYCGGTDGADYAIDDIRIYTQNSKVEVLQNSVLCSESDKDTKATIRMKHETLKAMIPFVPTGNTVPVYYRVCKEDGTVALSGYSKEMYLDFETGKTNDAGSYIADENGEHYFIIADNQDFALNAQQKYYVSVAMPVKNSDGTYSAPADDSNGWGNPTNVCSMYSETFQPLIQSLKLIVNGKGIERINIDCHKTDTRDDNLSITGALQVPNPETGELVSVDDPAMCSFDWVVEIKGETSIINEDFRKALQHFRNEYKKDTDDNYYTTLQEAKGEFTEEDRQLLQSAIDAGKLYITASHELSGPIYKVGNTYSITAIPLETTLEYKGNTYDVCPSPMEVMVEARLNGPELNLGFDDVNYEAAGLKYGAEAIRVGLQNLKDMQDGKPLHLPVSAYKQLQIENGEEYYKELSEYDLLLDDFDVIIWDSNDPTWTQYLSKDKDLFGTDGVWCIGDEASKSITNLKKFVEIQLHNKFVNNVFDSENKKVVESKEGADVVFHEGYWYKVKIRYSTSEDVNNNADYLQRCFGESYLTLKVVPEYVTWGEGMAANSNWLNDDNWTRSTKDELHKTDYIDNGDADTDLADLKVDGNPATFAYVPMKFTKVTILGGMHTPYPYLYHLENDPHSGILKRTSNGDNSPATTNIEYDMMVRETYGVCDNDPTKTEVYECERFYGNTCKEIYFQPTAQLRWQHYLTYNRAWVEMELTSNKWNTLTAPLENLVAGDMYVPTTGKQDTEAFKEITFGETYSGKEYNRVAYPIYQRSWDKADSKVVTADRGDFDASIIYGSLDGEFNTVATQWSHVYNDVTEKYLPGKGFSIRTHNADQTDKTLIRLPKDDTGYNYFDYSGSSSNVAANNIRTEGGDEQYRLAVDGVATGMLEVEPENNSDDNKYYLIGNPYMASLKMDLFFNSNPDFAKKYWTIEDEEVKSFDETSLGMIAPTRSFFVKYTGSGTPKVVLSPLMTASHLATVTLSDAAQAVNAKVHLEVTAIDGKRSTATVVLGDNASDDYNEHEDVEMLLDSNLADVPQLYTVAGNYAVMINRLHSIDVMPVGVVGKKNETVTLTFDGISRVAGNVYLFDVKKRTQTLLTDDMQLTVETNQHGRYFMTTRLLGGNEESAEPAVKCYSPSRNLLVVASVFGDVITDVRIYDASGRMVVADATAGSTALSYSLPEGMYVVKAAVERMERESVNKVVVR